MLSSKIRPRDGSSIALLCQRERQSPPQRQLNRDRSTSSDQLMKYPPLTRSKSDNNNNEMLYCGYPPRQSMHSMKYPPWNTYPLLRKTLTVANIPPEYTPKDIYELFSGFGKVEGAFVYLFPDTQGRRIGEVVMSTCLSAQKVKTFFLFVKMRQFDLIRREY